MLSVTEVAPIKFDAEDMSSLVLFWGELENMFTV